VILYEVQVAFSSGALVRAALATTMLIGACSSAPQAAVGPREQQSVLTTPDNQLTPEQRTYRDALKEFQDTVVPAAKKEGELNWYACQQADETDRRDGRNQEQGEEHHRERRQATAGSQHETAWAMRLAGHPRAFRQGLGARANDRKLPVTPMDAPIGRGRARAAMRPLSTHTVKRYCPFRHMEGLHPYIPGPNRHVVSLRLARRSR